MSEYIKLRTVSAAFYKARCDGMITPEEYGAAMLIMPRLETEEDVAPVNRGVWVEYAGSLVKCSVCGYEYVDKIECDAFCGNCGAKMDAETNAEV